MEHAIQLLGGSVAEVSFSRLREQPAVNSSSILQLSDGSWGDFVSGPVELAETIASTMGTFKWAESFRIGRAAVDIALVDEVDQDGNPILPATPLARASIGKQTVVIPGAGRSTKNLLDVFAELELEVGRGGLVAGRKTTAARPPSASIYFAQAQIYAAIEPAVESNLAQVPGGRGTKVDAGEVFASESIDGSRTVHTVIHVGQSTVSRIGFAGGQGRRDPDELVDVASQLSANWLAA